MSTSAMRLIQEALATLLAADATLMALVTDVVNDVPAPSGPDALQYPYVLISNASELPWHTMGTATTGIGWHVVVRLHIYSRYQGDKEALTILERLVTLLNFQSLTVAGYGTMICEYQAGRVLVEDREKIEVRHIPAEFKFWAHQ